VANGATEPGYQAEILAMEVRSNNPVMPAEIRYSTKISVLDGKELFTVPFHADVAIAQELVGIYMDGEGAGYNRALKEIDEYPNTLPLGDGPLEIEEETITATERMEGEFDQEIPIETVRNIRLFPEGTRIPKSPREFVKWFSKEFLPALSGGFNQLDGSYHGGFAALRKDANELNARLEALENGD